MARGDGLEGAASSGPAPRNPADVLSLCCDGVGEGLTATPALGAAASADGSVFTRLAGPLLEPQWDHDVAGLSDPAPVFDPETGLIVVYYTAFDGERLRIGRAEGCIALDGDQLAAAGGGAGGKRQAEKGGGEGFQIHYGLRLGRGGT